MFVTTINQLALQEIRRLKHFEARLAVTKLEHYVEVDHSLTMFVDVTVRLVVHLDAHDGTSYQHELQKPLPVEWEPARTSRLSVSAYKSLDRTTTWLARTTIEEITRHCNARGLIALRGQRIRDKHDYREEVTLEVELPIYTNAKVIDLDAERVAKDQLPLKKFVEVRW